MYIFIKRFTEWFQVKVRLDKQSHHPPLFNEGEVWWCSLGENVGGEISGKGDYFRRPMVVLRKLDKFSFIGLPLTSQQKYGTWYHQIFFKRKENTVILAQIRYVDYRRMDKLMGTINQEMMIKIRTATIGVINEQ